LKEKLSEFITLTTFLCSLDESITPQGMTQIQNKVTDLLRDFQKHLKNLQD